jgi:hypothetical protein
LIVEHKIAWTSKQTEKQKSLTAGYESLPDSIVI